MASDQGTERIYEHPIVREILKPGQTKERVVELYSSWSDTYDKDVMDTNYGLSPSTLVRYFDEHLKIRKDARIIDLLAGTGLVGEQLRKSGYENIDALDACQDMLEKAKQKGIYREYFQDFLGPNRLEIPDDTYDAAITTGSFVPGQCKTDCLGEIIRIIKAGGYFVLLMNEAHLAKPDFLDLEATMQHYHDNKLWKWISRVPVPDYADDDTGIIYVFCITKNSA